MVRNARKPPTSYFIDRVAGFRYPSLRRETETAHNSGDLVAYRPSCHAIHSFSSWGAASKLRQSLANRRHADPAASVGGNGEVGRVRQGLGRQALIAERDAREPSGGRALDELRARRQFDQLVRSYVEQVEADCVRISHFRVAARAANHDSSRLDRERPRGYGIELPC